MDALLKLGYSRVEIGNLRREIDERIEKSSDRGQGDVGRLRRIKRFGALEQRRLLELRLVDRLHLTRQMLSHLLTLPRRAATVKTASRRR
jgi:hypothetical protein